MSGEGSMDLTLTYVNDGSAPTIPVSLPIAYMYNLKCGAGRLRLECSRELCLPNADSSWGADSQLVRNCTPPRAHLTSVSLDDELIAVCLTDGHIWFYSLDSIAWVNCISSKIAVDYVPRMGNYRGGNILTNPPKVKVSFFFQFNIDINL